MAKWIITTFAVAFAVAVFARGASAERVPSPTGGYCPNLKWSEDVSQCKPVAVQTREHGRRHSRPH